MNEYIYLVLVLFCCFYFWGSARNVKMESFALSLMILIAPEILYKDLDNYVLDTFKDLPFLVLFFDNDSLAIAFRVLYFFSYPLCYYLFYKSTNCNKETRFLFFVFTFYTLGLNQLYLCFALSFYILSKMANNRYLKLLCLIVGFLWHASIFVLFFYDFYRYNRKLGLILFGIAIVILAINPTFYMMFSDYDYRIEQLSKGNANYEFVTYTFRSQIYSYVCLFIILFYHKLTDFIIILAMVFLFSLSISSLHAVMVRRFVELFFIGIIYAVALQHDTKIKSSNLILTVLTVFMIRAYFPYLMES